MGHGGRLNFGDVFSYALAKALDAPLLFIGEGAAGMLLAFLRCMLLAAGLVLAWGELASAQEPLQPERVGPLTVRPRDPATSPPLPDPRQRGLISPPPVDKVVRSNLAYW